jgi:MFS family permease
MALPQTFLPARNPLGLLGRSRNFRLFWSGQTLSLMGTWMQSMAQGWLALELTNDPLLVGAVATATSLPILLLSLHAGVLADRMDRLVLLRAMQTGMLAQACVLWWFVWSGNITIWWLLALAAFDGMLVAVEIPARNSLMADLVGLDDLPDAIALNSAGFNLARIIGPVVAGLAIGKLGIAWCFGLNALSYGFVLLGLALMRHQAPTREPMTGSPLEGIAELIAYVRQTRTIKALMEVVAVVGVCGLPYLTLMPVMARDRLGLGADGYGSLLACVGVGGLTAALWMAAASHHRNPGRLGRVTTAFALLLIGFAFSRSLRFSQLMLFGTGVTMIMNGAIVFGSLQRLVPDRLRGRLSSAYSLVVVGLAQVAGAFVAGAVARWVGPHWAIGGGGAIVLAFTVLAAKKYPELRDA